MTLHLIASASSRRARDAVQLNAPSSYSPTSLAALPWATINLVKLKLHATGKGNAKKPEMQATAKDRWGKKTWARLKRTLRGLVLTR